MAKRNIRHLGDDVLRKKSRTVETIDERIVQLLDDMAETMYDSEGVGLAAPQVGILKRIAVIDIGDGLIELINPEIVSFEGSEKDIEGCLSVPGRYGYVLRPEKVKVTALDRNGEKIEIEATGMLKKALCHEIDHLDGIIFVDKVTQYVEVDN